MFVPGNIQQNTLLIDIATRNVICLSPLDNLGEAAHVMAEKRISSVVVTDEEKRPLGIVTERNMLYAMQSGCSQETLLQKVMSSPVVTVPKSMACLDAYQTCLREGIRHLVIVDDDMQLYGMVSDTDFRQHIDLAALAGLRQISSIMSRTVFMLRPDTLLRDALNQMQSHRDTCVVVVDTAERPIGIVTERDVVRLYSGRSKQSDIQIGAVMTSPVVTMSLDCTINQAAEQLLATKGRHLVVVDHAGRVSGVLTERDLTLAMTMGLIDNKLIADSAFLNTLVNTIPDLIWLKDANGVYLACNPRFERFFGAKEKDIVGKTDYDFVYRELADFFREHDIIAMKKNAPSKNEEWVTFSDDGHRELLEVVKTPMRDSQGKLIGVLGIGRDITARKNDEVNLRIANRSLKLLSKCNAALIHADNEQELLADICRLTVEIGGYLMAWVGFAENDKEKTVRPVAQSGYEEGYLNGIKITWADTELGRGPTGTAIRNGVTEINQECQTNPKMAPWREAAIKRGYNSSVGLPLISKHQVLGALTIYSAQPNAFGTEEVALLEELANDLAYGIITLRTRAEHEQHAKILRQSLEQSIQTIAATVEARDPYTAGHQRRVAELAVAIGRELALPEEQINGIQLAAIIHDLGKIQVPAEILSKPGKLTDIELMLIKMHPQAGYDILKDVKFPWPIADIVRQHHERLDGSGYPQGLKDGQILLESRIMAVADVVEAMASHRPYRQGLGAEIALQEIKMGRGKLYDESVVDACLKLFREGRFKY